MGRLADLKPDQIDNKLTEALDNKQSITLSKYVFKAFEMLDKKDQSKSSEIVISCYRDYRCNKSKLAS